MTPMRRRLAVLTLAHGRHDHLRGQIAGLTRGRTRPDLHVIAAMDDRAIAQVAGAAWEQSGASVDLVIVDLMSDPRGLPLAQARNRAAKAAIGRQAEHLVFLDVDCIPGPEALAAYAQHLGVNDASRPAIVGGDVAYLPPLPAGQTDWTANLDRLAEQGEHRLDRVRLEAGERRAETDLNRFWSLSFALTADDFLASGGFCEDYVGYGGEDTDFAQQIKAAGGSLTWIGGATAYHQHHASESPPVRQREAVVRNAGIFADRWGWWPMQGWLEGFRQRGLAAIDAEGRWRVTN